MTLDLSEMRLINDTSLGLELVLSESGFIHDYFNYASPLTEAPEIYHTFAGFAILASIVSRRIWLPFGSQSLYPNLWIVLIGSSSQLKKSTAIAIAQRLLITGGFDVAYPNEFSRESMIEILAARPQGIYLFNELGGVLKNFEAKYMMGTKEMLTEIFDCPPLFKRSLKSKEIRIENPCVSILAASTANWLNRAIREHDIKGGFLPRFIFVPADKPSKLLPLPPSPDLVIQLRLTEKLRGIAQFEGECSLSKDATDLYERWYRRSAEENERDPDTEIMSPFYSRLTVYVLKFAMLYQVSYGDGLVISVASMDLSIKLVDLIKTYIRRLFDTELLISPEAELAAKVLKIIQQEPGIARSGLLRKSRAYSKHLDGALGRLIEGGQVVEVKNGSRERIYTPVDRG